MLSLLLPFVSGCSPDVIEISDIALVMALGIDYDQQTKLYTFSTYNVMPTALSTDKAGKLTGWTASVTGKSVIDTGRNLRGRLGKTLIFQHNKFVLIGEEAATHSFYEIMDFLMRNRQIRLTSYLVVTEGQASDKLKVRTQSGDLLSNDLFGKVRNEKEWGKSMTQSIQMVANWYTDPCRGFVTGRLGVTRQKNDTQQALALRGGAVFNKGKFKQWIQGDDVLVIQLLSERNRWKNLEFPRVVSYKGHDTSIYFKPSKQSIRSRFRHGKPSIEIALTISAALGEIGQPLPLNSPAVIASMEKAASKEIERLIQASLASFQHVIRADVLGFSQLLSQYHPTGWAAIKQNWDEVYPSMPVTVHVNVKIEKVGMIQYAKERQYAE